MVELAVVAHIEASCPSFNRSGKRAENLEDKLFGHLPSELWSAKVAVGGCLLVDRPLQVQFPGIDKEEMAL